MENRMPQKKEEILNELDTGRWTCAYPIMKKLGLQYHQIRLCLNELIAEGKVESCVFNKRTKYRKFTPLGGENGEIQAIKSTPEVQN